MPEGMQQLVITSSSELARVDVILFANWLDNFVKQQKHIYRPFTKITDNYTTCTMICIGIHASKYNTHEC